MSQEDRQFLDGLLTGAIIASFVLIIILAVVLFRSGNQVGENIPQPPDLIEERDDASIDPIADTEPLDDAAGQLLETIAIKGQQYVVVQLLEHPIEDLMFRLLALDSPTLEDRISKSKAFEYSHAFNGDTIYYTNDDRNKHFEKVVFSFWTADGQELMSIDDDNKDMPTAPVGYVRVLKWLGGNLILEGIQGDAGTGHHEIYKYNPNDQSIESLIRYQTGWSAKAETRTEMIYSTWSQNGRTIGQIVDKLDGSYSNLYYLPSKDIDWQNLSQYMIAYQTTSEVAADIKSDNNLIRYSEGLEILVEGESVFIPWTAK